MKHQNQWLVGPPERTSEISGSITITQLDLEKLNQEYPSILNEMTANFQIKIRKTHYRTNHMYKFTYLSYFMYLAIRQDNSSPFLFFTTTPQPHPNTPIL